MPTRLCPPTLMPRIRTTWRGTRLEALDLEGHAGRLEPVDQHGAHRGRGGQDAARGRQPLAIERQAQRALAQHQRGRLVAGVALRRDARAIVLARRRLPVDLDAEEAL